VVIYSHLAMGSLIQIVHGYVKKLNKMLSDRGLAITLTEAAAEWIANQGYQRDYGARPMKRAFQKEIQNPLATYILEGKFESGTTIKVDAISGQLVFK
jgi:ATP-dependent Clp protease ATP-binding subunit ClpB